MRVLHVLRSLEWGGVEEMALRIAEWSNRNGVEAGISARPGPLRERVSAGVPVFERDDTSFAELTVQLAGTARRWGATTLHAHQRREALACLVVGRLLGITVVEHAHTEIPDRRGRRLSFRSARVFAVSQPVADMVVRDFARPRDRVIVVDNVPALVTSDAVAKARSEACPDVLRVLGIGRVTEQKDPERFVRVVAELADRTPVEARWIGTGPMLAAMRELTRDGPASFTGPEHDVEGPLRAADVLLMTSRWEGLPLVALEALACGTPVVAVAAGGLRDLLEGQECGVVLDAALTDAACAEAVLGALRDSGEVDQRVRNGTRLIRERYSPDLAFGRIHEEYRSLA